MSKTRPLLMEESNDLPTYEAAVTGTGGSATDYGSTTYNPPGRRSSITRALSSRGLGGISTGPPSASGTTSLGRRNSFTGMTAMAAHTAAAALPFNMSSGRSAGSLCETYFCHVCFTKNAMKDGFRLSECGHMFCTECIEGYLSSQIRNGIVLVKCFHPVENDNESGKDDSVIIGSGFGDSIEVIIHDEMKSMDEVAAEQKQQSIGLSSDDSGLFAGDTDQEHMSEDASGPANSEKLCGKKISDRDLRQLLSADMYEKYEKFRTSAENPDARECPYCHKQQGGDPDNPIMTCIECKKQFCFFHSNAHPMDMPCENYEASRLKEDKLNSEVTKDAKPCPRCKYMIEKNGGCNHMKCAKCKCSFCWLCMEIIEDVPLPSHYKEGECAGKQFEGDDSLFQDAPQWLIWCLVCFMCIFGLPSLAIALPLGILCFPLAKLCDAMIEDDPAERSCDFSTVVLGCWGMWLLLFFIIVIAIPLSFITRTIRCIGHLLCGRDPCQSCVEGNRAINNEIRDVFADEPDGPGGLMDDMTPEERAMFERALAESREEYEAVQRSSS